MSFLNEHSRVLLTNRLIALKRRLSLGDRSVSLEISQVEQDLKSLILADLEGSKIRSRILLLEEGERATRFFFGLERKRASQNLVSSSYDENGVEVFWREEIERAHVAFYTKLFSEEPIDECYKQMCFDNISSTLSPDRRDSCEGELTLSELTSSVNSLSLNRSPRSRWLNSRILSSFLASFRPAAIAGGLRMF